MKTPLTRFRYIPLISFLLMVGLLLPLHFVSAQIPGINLGSIASGALFKIVSWVVSLITFGVGYTLLPLFASIVNWGFSIGSFMTAPVVTQGWTVVRDFVNMFFILIFLIIAFATIMRFESYGMKTLLTRFLLAALLINFSLFFGGILIDIGNDVAAFFVTGGNTQENIDTDVAASIMYAIGLNRVLDDAERVGEMRDALESSDGKGNQNFSILISAVFMLAMILVVAFLFMVIAALLILRIVILWILLILSPLAWASIILPGTRNIWSKWWNQFLSWTFLPAVVAFFIWLGVLIGGAVADIPFIRDAQYVTEEFKGSFPYSGHIEYFLQYITVLIIIWFGVIVGKSWSATGSELVFQGADGARNWALGKVKAVTVTPAGRLGEWAAKTTAGTAVNVIPESQRRKFVERLERTKVIGRAIGGPGARYQRRRAWVEEQKKNMSDDENDLRNIIAQTVTTDAGRARRAAAIEKLTETGKLRDQDFNVKHLKDLEWAGGDIEKVVQQRPDWAMDHTVQNLLANYRKTKFDWAPILKLEDPEGEYRDVNDNPEVDLATGENKTRRQKAAEELMINETIPKKAGDFSNISKRSLITWKEYQDGLEANKGNKVKQDALHNRWRMTQRIVGDFDENVHTFDLNDQGDFDYVTRAAYYGAAHLSNQGIQNPQGYNKITSPGNLTLEDPKRPGVLLVRENVPDQVKARYYMRPGGTGKHAEAATMPKAVVAPITPKGKPIRPEFGGRVGEYPDTFVGGTPGTRGESRDSAAGGEEPEVGTV